MKGEGLFVEKTFEPFENRNLKYPTQTGVRKILYLFSPGQIRSRGGQSGREGRWLFLKQCQLRKCVEYIFK